jgi:hypothetical protein
VKARSGRFTTRFPKAIPTVASSLVEADATVIREGVVELRAAFIAVPVRERDRLFSVGVRNAVSAEIEKLAAEGLSPCHLNVFVIGPTGDDDGTRRLVWRAACLPTS